MRNKDGTLTRPLGKKGAGNLWISLPLTKVTLDRLTPKGAGHFVKLDKDAGGRYRYAVGFQKTDDDFFDAEMFGPYKRCVDALAHLYNVGLPEHFAMGVNTEGTPITTCLPQIKEKWEDFKKRWLESTKKAAGREAVKLAKEAAKKAGSTLSKKEMEKILSAATKKVEFDEVTAREDFRDELIENMASDDNKFLRSKNPSIINAEVRPPRSRATWGPSLSFCAAHAGRPAGSHAQL